MQLDDCMPRTSCQGSLGCGSLSLVWAVGAGFQAVRATRRGMSCYMLALVITGTSHPELRFQPNRDTAFPQLALLRLAANGDGHLAIALEVVPTWKP